MDLYKLKNKKLEKINRKPFESEKEIHSLVEDNLEDLFGLELVSSEFSIDNFRLDSLCYDSDNNSFVIIEYKKGSSYSVIDQGYSYLSILLNNKADFILEYYDKKGKNIKKDDVDWSQSKIIFISPSFNSYQKNSVNFKDVPFELWEIKRFSKKTFLLSQIKSDSNESINKIAKQGTIGNVSKEIKVLTEEDVLKKASQKVKDLWKEIQSRFDSLGFDDYRISFKPNYCRLASSNNSVVAYFNFQKERIKIDLIGGGIDSDGKKSKNYCKINDPAKITKMINYKWKSGHRTIRYQIIMNDDKDIDYIMSLIKQKTDYLLNK